MREKEKGGNEKDRKRKGGVEKRKMKKKKENLSGWGTVFMERRKRQRNWKTGERETSKGDGEKGARGRTQEEEKSREQRSRRRQPRGFPKLQTLPRELRGAPGSPASLPGPGAPPPTSRARNATTSQNPIPAAPHLSSHPSGSPRHPVSCPHSHPQPFLLPPALLPLPPPPRALLACELQTASPPDILTTITLQRPPHP